MADISKMQRRWGMLKLVGFRQVIFTFALICLCAIAIFFCRGTEYSIRMSGLFLQISGMWLVIHGLNKTLQEFGEKSILSSIWSWLVNFCSGEPRRVYGKGSAGMALEASHQADFTLASLPKDAQTEERLRRLEGGMDALMWQVSNDRRATHVVLDKIRNELKREADGRQQDLGDLSAKVYRVHAGGAGITLMGTVWLLCGVVLGTISGELSKWSFWNECLIVFDQIKAL